MEVHSQHHGLIIETANRVALDILSSRTGIEALRHIAEAARVLAGARYAALGVASQAVQGHQELQEFITVGVTPDEQARIGPLPRGRGVLGLLLECSEPLRIDDLTCHPASVGFPAHHPPMKSFLGVPIRRGVEVLGSLYLTNKQGGGTFTRDDEAAVQALGAHAAVAIHNLHLLARQSELMRGLLTAQDEERRAIAYDLHDGLTQYIMASHAHLEASQRARTAGREDKAERDLESGLKYLKEAVLESRRMVNNLRHLLLDDLGLAAALEQLLQEEKERCGWTDADFIHNIGEQRFDKTMETCVYRVLQESLTNARKHAETRRVRVTMLQEKEEHGGRRLLLEVRDWGKGFVPAERIGATGRVGLQGIIERIHLLHGTYVFQSAPGEGTTIRAAFPVTETDYEPTKKERDA